MASTSAYKCSGCSKDFDDSYIHLTSTKCLSGLEPKEREKIFQDHLQEFNSKEYKCENPKCNLSFHDTGILKHLTSKSKVKCKEYYVSLKKFDSLERDIKARVNVKRRLKYPSNPKKRTQKSPTDANLDNVSGLASTSQQITTAKRPKNVLSTRDSSTTIFVKDDSEEDSNALNLDCTDSIGLKQKHAKPSVNNINTDVIQVNTSGNQQKSSNVLATPSVMIYVNDEGEEDFNALHLDQTDINGLKEAIQAKYGKYQNTIIGLLYLIKKGHRVILDDRMVTRFRDETFFWMKTNPMDMINTISITLSEEMFPSEPTETSVSRRENEVFANPSTSETTSRDNTRESRPNGTTSVSLVQASNPSDRPEDGLVLFTGNGLNLTPQQQTVNGLNLTPQQQTVNGLNLTPQLQTVNGLNLTPQQQAMDLDELIKSLDLHPHFRHRLSVVLHMVLINCLSCYRLFSTKLRTKGLLI